MAPRFPPNSCHPYLATLAKKASKTASVKNDLEIDGMGRMLLQRQPTPLPALSALILFPPHLLINLTNILSWELCSAACSSGSSAQWKVGSVALDFRGVLAVLTF